MRFGDMLEALLASVRLACGFSGFKIPENIPQTISYAEKIAIGKSEADGIRILAAADRNLRGRLLAFVKGSPEYFRSLVEKLPEQRWILDPDLVERIHEAISALQAEVGGIAVHLGRVRERHAAVYAAIASAKAEAVARAKARKAEAAVAQAAASKDRIQEASFHGQEELLKLLRATKPLKPRQVAADAAKYRGAFTN